MIRRYWTHAVIAVVCLSIGSRIPHAWREFEIRAAGTAMAVLEAVQRVAQNAADGRQS